MGLTPFTANDPNRPRCGAKTKGGGTCGQIPLANGNGRCYIHKGRPKGIPQPGAVTHARFSQYAPERLQARIDAAMADSELTSLRPGIALLLVRIQDLMGRLDTDTPDPEDALGLLDDGNLIGLKALLQAQQQDRGTWLELRATLIDYNRLADTEQRRQLASEQYLSLAQANVLIAALLHLVQEHVTDTRARNRISAGIYALCHREPPTPKALPEP